MKSIILKTQNGRKFLVEVINLYRTFFRPEFASRLITLSNEQIYNSASS